MSKTQLSIPCHWNKKVLNEIVKQNLATKDIKITEIYGTLAKGPIGHGRSSSSVPDISRKYAIDFRKYVKSVGLKFIYLINAPFSFEGSKRKEVENYLYWIVNKFKADALMITSYELMEFIRKKYPKIPIFISTIAGIKNAKQLETFKTVFPSRVVVHHDTNRNFKDLKEIIKKSKKWSIEIELMATESCLRRCPNREAHYKHLSGGNIDKPFHTVCNTKKLLYPREFIKANFIRPEDLRFYEKIGIKLFKITGRSKKAAWLPEVTRAYLNRKYSGNLIRLLGIDPSLEAEKWIYINNSSLDGFLENFPVSGSEEEENIYCDKWISKLYNEGNFTVRDNSKYGVRYNSSLYCKKPGKRIFSIVFKEKEA